MKFLVLRKASFPNLPSFRAFRTGRVVVSVFRAEFIKVIINIAVSAEAGQNVVSGRFCFRDLFRIFRQKLLFVGDRIPENPPHMTDRGFDVVAITGTKGEFVPIGVCCESGVGEFHGDVVLLAELVCDFGVSGVSHSWFSPFYLFLKNFVECAEAGLFAPITF
uniref:Uncharacterized protein n=1 Tax=Siphoviridae sp. ctnpt50 TaxID=2827941 RepID=A0A8S5SDT3_9CAUD|nr:MAG TPA: hypothetical protein [Siphoviridae sp. ctnpt50]